MNDNSFELGFVHLEDLTFHEACDFRRVRLLADQIKKDGHLKNPALVAVLPGSEPTDASFNGSGKLMVLDGINRISALKLLGFPDVLVQKVDLTDKKVRLASWDHLIFDIDQESLTGRLKSLDLKISPCDRNQRKEALNDEKAVCCMLFRDGSCQLINQNQPSLEERVRNLYRVIALYNNSWEIFHPGWEEGLISPFDNFEKATAINSLPTFTREQVIHLASKGALFPFGVTRFVVLRRILGLEISCSVLEDKAPLSEKNLFLKELLSYRIKSKKTKFYQESVFLFNE